MAIATRSIRRAIWRGEEAVEWASSEAAWKTYRLRGRLIAALRVAAAGARAAGAALRQVLRPVGDRIAAAVRPLTRRVAAGVRPVTRRLAAAPTAVTSALVAGAVAALVAGVAVLTGGTGPSRDAPGPDSATAATVSPEVVPASSRGTLAGATPSFERDKADAAPAKPAGPPRGGGADAEALSVAWEFSQAFVAYEVGTDGVDLDQTFASTATPALASSLKRRPPRLPADVKVPRARVLNVLLGPKTKDTVEVSVALVRLRAATELRLTLKRRAGEWRVSQVRG